MKAPRRVLAAKSRFAAVQTLEIDADLLTFFYRRGCAPVPAHARSARHSRHAVGVRQATQHALIPFSHGDSADCVFYLQSWRLKVTVVSANGKEATIAIRSAGDSIGEGSLVGSAEHRLATVTAITSSNAIRFTRSELVGVMHDEQAFSDLFVSHLLARSIRTQVDLVVQLFKSSEKRLARLLLRMADYGATGTPAKFIPSITLDTLAEIVGTRRSHVSLFVNCFRRLGFIDFNGRIQVRKNAPQSSPHRSPA